MLKILYARCLGLSPSISANSVLKCAQHPKIAKKYTKNLFLRGSWSFKVIDVNKSKKLVTSACYGKQHVCVYLQPVSYTHLTLPTNREV